MDFWAMGKLSMVLTDVAKCTITATRSQSVQLIWSILSLTYGNAIEGSPCVVIKNINYIVSHFSNP